MSHWSLPDLLDSLHRDLEHRLAIARKSFGHPGTKGDAAEGVWLELLQAYLPARYQASRAHVVDSQGNFSDQIDIVVFDRQYSPFIFNFQGQQIIPAESVYAIFEAKQAIDAGVVAYAQQKAASVRRLHRTTLPIPHAGGTYPPKPLSSILAGVLALESNWSPALGPSLLGSLDVSDPMRRLDLGCVAAHGVFMLDPEKAAFRVTCDVKPAVAFLFSLMGKLQQCATVPMIDIDAYAAWITRDNLDNGT